MSQPELLLYLSYLPIAHLGVLHSLSAQKNPQVVASTLPVFHQCLSCLVYPVRVTRDEIQRVIQGVPLLQGELTLRLEDAMLLVSRVLASGEQPLGL